MALPRSVQDRLHAAYTFVRGQEVNKSIASLTLDHLIQERIDAIQGGESRYLIDFAGTSNTKRASKLDQLDDVQKAIDEVVQVATSKGT